MSYAIEFINETARTVDYSEQAVGEYEQGAEDTIEVYTQRFEREYAGACASEADDIGGLIVYSHEGIVSAVYDYENFCGWVV